MKGETRSVRFVLLVVGFVLIGVFVGSSHGEGVFLKGPYLQNVRQDGITIMWETSSEMGTKVEYGPDESYGYERTVSGRRTIHEVTLEGLEVGSVYHYRVISDDLVSEDYTFRTAPLRDSPFRFVVYGDNRTYPERHAEVVGGIISSGPDIVINVGDVVTHGEVYDEWGDEFFGPAHDLMVGVPVYVSIGNHEGNSHWFYDFFSFPPPEDYYSFDYGNSHFIVLDTNIGYGVGSSQYEYLSSAECQQADHIFVFFHHPPWSQMWDSPGYTGEAKVRRYLVPVLEEFGVDMVFSGHTHDYERGLHDGVFYIISGGGGAALDRVQTGNWPHISIWESVYHYCVVDVDGRKFDFRAVGLDGQVIDELHFSEGSLENVTASPAGISLDNRVPLTITAEVEGIPSEHVVSVTADLAELGGNTAAMHDDGLGGDEVAGDNIYTLRTEVAGDVGLGSKRIRITLTDREERQAYGSAMLFLYPPVEQTYIYRDGINPLWRVTATGVEYDEGCKEDPYEGEASLEFSVPSGKQGLLSFVYRDEGGFGFGGYSSIELYVKSLSPEGKLIFQIMGKNFQVGGEGGIPLEIGKWTRVELPLAELSASECSLSGMILFIKSMERVYIDGMRFVPAYTAVEEAERPGSRPEGYHLYQNFPNPFNPSTEIVYVLPEMSRVRLVVYNVMGCEVARLVDGVQPAGFHRVVWDASGMPAGVYLYRLSADGFERGRGMVLLK